MNLKEHINFYRNSNFFRKVLTGSFWLVAGSTISKFLLALAYILLARMLPASEYGEYGILKSTIDNFLIFATLGVGLTTTKYISENKNDSPEVAAGVLGTSLLTVFGLGLVVAGGIFLFSDLLAVEILNSEKLKPLLSVVAIILVFTSLNGVQLGALIGLQSFQKTAIANIFQGIFLFFGIVIGGYLGGVKGAIIGNLLGIILLFFIVQYILRKELKFYKIFITLKTWRKDFKKIYKFALPASLSTLITAPTIWYLSTMLARAENGYVELGIYSAAIVFTAAIQMINGTLSNVLLPIFLSKETEITPKKDFFNYFGAWLIAITISLPLMVYPELVGEIVGKHYDKEVLTKVVGFALVSTLIISHRQGVSRDLIIRNKMWLSVFSMLQWSLTSILFFSYARFKGAATLSLALCSGYFVNLLVFLPILIKLKITPKFLFYNFRVWLIWSIVFILIFVSLYGAIIFRLITLPLIIVLFFLIVNMYKNVVKN